MKKSDRYERDIQTYKSKNKCHDTTTTNYQQKSKIIQNSTYKTIDGLTKSTGVIASILLCMYQW